MGKSERLIGGNDHVCTPEKIWGPVHNTFPGGIILDPFSNPKSKVPAKHKVTNWTYKTKPPPNVTVGDGLKVDWSGHRGVVWLNGPYSADKQNGLKQWMRKAVETNQKAPGQDMVLFVPVRTSGSAWQEFGFFGQAICYLNFRVQHDYEDSTSPFHQALIYFGQRASHFTNCFETYGTIFTEIRESVYHRWPISLEHAANGADDSEEAVA